MHITIGHGHVARSVTLLAVYPGVVKTFESGRIVLKVFFYVLVLSVNIISKIIQYHNLISKDFYL